MKSITFFVVMLFASVVLSDYIALVSKSNFVHITEKGEVTTLKGFADSVSSGIGAFGPPHTYYLFTGSQLLSYNTASGQSQVVALASFYGSAFCVSQKTGTLYSFNSTDTFNSYNISLVSIIPNNGTVLLLSNLPAARRYLLGNCVVDDANDVVYWVGYYASSSQEPADVLVTDLKTYATRRIATFSDTNNQVVVYIGADDELYILEYTGQSRLFHATVPASGNAQIDPITPWTATPSELFYYGVAPGATNPDLNALVLFGNQMYVWQFKNGSTIQNMPLSPQVSVNLMSVAWVPAF